jgi:hypothetical protein
MAIEAGLVVGLVIQWALRKAGRIGKGLDSEVDRVVDEGLKRLDKVVTSKLAGDPALTVLEREAAAGEVSVRTTRRLELAVEEAAETDQDFGKQVRALIDGLKGRGGSPFGGQAPIVIDSKGIQINDRSILANQDNNFAGPASRPDKERTLERASIVDSTGRGPIHHRANTGGRIELIDLRGVQIGDHNFQINRFVARSKTSDIDFEEVLARGEVAAAIRWLQLDPEDGYRRDALVHTLQDQGWLFESAPITFLARPDGGGLWQALCHIVAFDTQGLQIGDHGRQSNTFNYLIPGTVDAQQLLRQSPTLAKALCDLLCPPLNYSPDPAMITRQATEAIEELTIEWTDRARGVSHGWPVHQEVLRIKSQDGVSVGSGNVQRVIETLRIDELTVRGIEDKPNKPSVGGLRRDTERRGVPPSAQGKMESDVQQSLTTETPIDVDLPGDHDPGDQATDDSPDWRYGEEDQHSPGSTTAEPRSEAEHPGGIGEALGSPHGRTGPRLPFTARLPRENWSYGNRQRGQATGRSS